MLFLDFFRSKESKKTGQIEKEAQFKDTFILALVHRLRTPLNGARWSMDAVIGSGLSDENKKILTEGYDKVLSAINTVNEILKVAEINSEEGNFGLRKEKLNLCSVVDDILNSLNFLIKKKEITLVYDNKCDPITVFGDKEMLDLGLTNIFDNAFRYSPKGTVSVSISKEGSMAKLVVKDNGIGIDREDLKHTFEKFHRGKNAVLIDPNESGVGLFATKKIIEMHQGNISINSEENTGTTVEVRLPMD